VFADSDVVGKDYRLSVEQRKIDGKTVYFVAVV
jgi:hypothetical protein